MRAVVCHEVGALSDLRIDQRPSRPCGPHELRIRVAACGVNFVDALFVQGRYQIKPATPFVPGSEFAGTVAECGERVTEWSVGDRVLANVGLGGFCDEAVIGVAQAVRVPDGLALTTAAAVGQSYSTAWFALRDRAGVRAGHTVLVLGAGGGVGLAAVDVAASAGATVIAAASSDAKLAAAAEAGAHHLVNYGTDDLKTAVRALAPGGVDIVVDPVGGELTEIALRLAGYRGQVLIIGFASGEIPRLAANQILLRNRSVVGIDWGLWAMEHPAEQAVIISSVLDAVAAGTLHPARPTEYPLDRAAEALDDLQSRRVGGKVVLVP